MSLLGRFVCKIDVDSGTGCWNWTGYLDTQGYGRFSIGRARAAVRAYRVAHELFVGQIPDGLEPDHLCRNRRCVNPMHLELVTHTENVLRGASPCAVNARKTHCPRNHPYDSARPNGWRRCSTCDKEAEQRRTDARSLARAARRIARAAA